MADGVELGTAFVSIIPEVSKVGNIIKDALMGAGHHADEAGKSIGEKLGVGLKGALKDPIGELEKAIEGIGKGKLGADGAFGISTGALKAGAEIGGLVLAIGEVGHALFKMGEQWVEVADSISHQTGIIGDRLEELTNRVGEISTKVAASPEAIANNMAQLIGPLKLTQEQLDSLTTTVSQLDSWAGQAPVNLKALSNVLLEFREVGEASDALSQLQLVSQHTHVQLNDLLDMLQTAGPVADQFGLSMTQVTNAISAMDEAGLNPEKGITALRMALGNLAQDGKKLQEVMGGKFAPDENALQRLKDVIEKIQELYKAGDTIDADKLGIAAFSKKNWVDLADAIEHGKINVDDLNTSVRESGPNIDTQTKATEHFKEEWKKTENQIKLALKPLSEDVFHALDLGLTNFSNKLDAFINGGSFQKFLSQFTHGPDKNSAIGWLWNWITGGPPPDQIDPNQQPPPPPLIGGGTPNNRITGGAPNVPGPDSGGVTTPNINVDKPFYPLDLNAADKPFGFKTYDEWVSAQRQVQSALDRRNDASEALAKAQEKQRELLDKGNATQEEINNVAEEINKAQRESLITQQDLTVAQQKYIEGANRATEEFKGGHGFLGDLIELAAKMAQIARGGAGLGGGPPGTIPSLINQGFPSAPSPAAAASAPAATSAPPAAASSAPPSAAPPPPAAPANPFSAAFANLPSVSAGTDLLGLMNAAGAPAAAAASAAIPSGLTPTQAAVYRAMIDSGFQSSDWQSIANIIGGVPGTDLHGESGWNVAALNDYDSNAAAGNPSRGLGQLTLSNYRNQGVDPYTNDPYLQGKAMMGYIKGRYTNPSNAWSYWQVHKNYSTGGQVDSVPAMLAPGEHVLTADDVSALGGQSGVYALRNALHMAEGGSVDEKDPKRKPGFIPSGAANTQSPGTGGISAIFNLGDEAVSGLIDEGVSAASSAIAAGVAGGTFGIGAAGGSQAAGAAAQIGLSMAANAAKTGVKYGFKLGSIGLESLLEIGSPFGTPRAIGYDYTKALPNLDQLGQPILDLEKALLQNQNGGSATLPNGQHLPSGATPGKPIPPGPGGSQPQPGKGKAGHGLTDMQNMFGFDDGGMLMPGMVGVNMTRQPEPVFTDTQWRQIQEILPTDGGSNGPNFGVHIEHLHVQDADDLKRQIDSQQRLAMMRYTGRPY